jgi:hypothetical protein
MGAAGAFAIFYRPIWKHIGGRPWTYIMRDFAYRNPVLVGMMCFVGGIIVSPLWKWHEMWPLGAGFLIGHLFWGTKWRKGQKG